MHDIFVVKVNVTSENTISGTLFEIFLKHKFYTRKIVNLKPVSASDIFIIITINKITFFTLVVTNCNTSKF